MKRLTCEMCGGTDLVKEGGVFVCQTCGCKYSVEEAKKMMIEGTVEVQGTVKVDSSDELKKLYQAARNARKTSDDETALRHYENISAKDPDSWEALFYLVILKTNSIKNNEIASSAVSVTNSLNRVFQLIKENVSDEEERKSCVKEVVEQCNETASWLSNASENFYKTMTKGNGLRALTGITGMISSALSTGEALNENQDRYYHIANMMCVCGDAIERYCGLEDSDYNEYATWSWKKMLDFDATYKKAHGVHIFNDECRAKYETKIVNLKSKDKTKKINEYWEQRPEEKAKLEEEKKLLEDQIESISEIRDLDEKSRLEQKISELVEKRNGLGLFKSKEKNAIWEEITSYRETLKVVNDRIDTQKAEIEKKIAPLKSRLDEINEELTKDR